MAKFGVKKGDNVMVIAGKDKGKSGKILKVLPKEKRVYVEGANIVSKSKKPRSAQDKGGILKQEGKMDISSVMPICPSCKQVVRVRHAEATVGGKVKSVRICAKCGKPLDEKKSAVKKAAKKVVQKKSDPEKVEAAPVDEQAEVDRGREEDSG